MPDALASIYEYLCIYIYVIYQGWHDWVLKDFEAVLSTHVGPTVGRWNVGASYPDFDGHQGESAAKLPMQCICLCAPPALAMGSSSFKRQQLLLQLVVQYMHCCGGGIGIQPLGAMGLRWSLPPIKLKLARSFGQEGMP